MSNSVISGPIFEGSLEDFNRFVGPKLRNVIQNFTRFERNAQKGVCEYCGKTATPLQSAHKEGEERPEIIKKILEDHFSIRKNWYRVDLSKFEEHFKDAHTPIRDHIFFLCAECHDKYDKKKTITTFDIEQRRKSKQQNQFDKNKVFSALDDCFAENKEIISDKSWDRNFEQGLNLRGNILIDSCAANRNELNNAIKEWAIYNNLSLFVTGPDEDNKNFKNLALEPSGAKQNHRFTTTHELFELDDMAIEGLNSGRTALFIEDFDKIRNKEIRKVLCKFANAPIVLDKRGNIVNLNKFLFVIASFSGDKDDWHTLINYDSKNCFISLVSADK